MDILLGTNPTHTHKMDCPKLRGGKCNCNPKPIESDIWKDFKKTFINSTEWAEALNSKDFTNWFNEKITREYDYAVAQVEMMRKRVTGIVRNAQEEDELLSAGAYNEALYEVVDLLKSLSK
jgi:hypothetical protein